MSSDLRINPFNQAAQSIGAIGGSQSVQGGSSGKSKSVDKSQLFAGKTSGINESMNGQAVYTAGQAGVADGVAGKKLNLIG